MNKTDLKKFAVVEIDVNEINPADYNPREITEEALEGLKESIRKFGLVENLVVNKDMTLISGHQRLRAALELGYETVLDAFGGSGSTLLAAEQMDRTAYLIELDPFYVSAVVERWENFTLQTHQKLT